MSVNKKKSKQQVKATAKISAMEELLGPNLLTSKDQAVPTDTALKGKALVALYFGASWHQKCQLFDPLLKEFYTEYGRSAKLEIVYMSADSTEAEFNDYFDKMPWTALPIDREGGLTKGRIAHSLNVKGVPVLVILDAATGYLVSDQAAQEVRRAMTSDGGNDDKAETIKACKDLVIKWNDTTPLPFHEATLTGGLPSFMQLSIRDKIWTVLKTKWFVIVLILVLKWYKYR
mmetsp:Transcript_29687/g.64286  ORF Transcript_29687/g.64286 Transcript_29687/m.64286 type:complete len:231 (-) Transcript_29687:84-776(-)